MSTILCYIALYVIIVSGSISLSYVLKKKNCQTLPMCFLIIMVTLYLFGILKILKIGIYCIIFGFPCILIGCIVHGIAHKKIEIKQFMNKDIIIFTILYVVFAITTYNRIFTACDDYGYWSMAVKNMYYLDDFVTNSNSIIRLVYPPFPTMLQYFFEKVIMENRQGIELFASILFGITLLLPIIKNIKEKKKFALLCCLLIIIAIPAIFVDSWFYMTIYVDTLLGILLGYILFEYYSSEKDLFLKLELILAFFVLTLTKPTGIILALILVCIFLIDIIIKEYRKNKFNKFINRVLKNYYFKFVILLLIITICAFMSWEIHKYFSNSNSQNDSEKESLVSTVIQTIKGIFINSPESQEDINSLIYIIPHLMDKTIYSSKPIALSAGTWFGIFTIISYTIYKKILKRDKNFSSYVVAIFLGMVIYICLLQLAYIFVFPNYEAESHVSIERYVGTFLISILIFLVGITINEYNKKSESSYAIYAIILVIVLNFTPMEPIINVTIGARKINNLVKNAAIDMIEGSNKVPTNLTENSRLYVLHQTYMLNDNFVKFQYYSYPIKVKTYQALEILEDETKIYDQKIKFEELLKKQYDYVFIIGKDEYFISNYQNMFEEEITEWTLYKIEKENGQIKLISVK